MGANTWTASADEDAAAINGITLQATAYGLDVDDKCVQAFIMHVAAVQAALVAQGRYYCNVIRENTERGDYIDE